MEGIYMAVSFVCTIERTQGTAFLVVTSLAWHWADLSHTVTEAGGPATARDIEVGGAATVTVENGAVTRVALGAPVLSTPFAAGVRVYSTNIFPVKSLEDVYSYSEAGKAAIKLIGCRCVGVRKCNTGTDMSFWQAFAVAFTEHLGRKSTSIAALRTAINCVEETGGGELVGHLRELERYKAGGKGGMEWVTGMEGEEEFWSRLAEVWREYAGKYLESLGNTVDFLDMDAATAQELLADPLNEIGIKLMCKSFSLKITVYSPHAERFKQSYAPDDPAGDQFPLYFFRDNTVFHILYTPLQVEIDGSFIDGTPVKKPAKLTVHSLLSQKKDRITLKSTVEADVIKGGKRVGRLVQFTEAAQRYVRCVCTMVDSRGMVDFYPSDLFKSGLLMTQEHKSAVARIDRLFTNTDFPVVSQTVSTLKSLQGDFSPVYTHFLSHKNICEYCQSAQGSVVLDCTHVFCYPDIAKFVLDSLNSNPLLLKPNGDTTEGLRCMKVSCFARITGRKLREIIPDDDFAAWVQCVEEKTQTKCCWRCGKVREISGFVDACTCGRRMCAFCVCDLYRRNQGYCVCGVRFSAQVQERVKREKKLCAVCFLEKTIVGNFSHIECEDHILCHDCISTSAKYSQRCRLCYRLFSREEMTDLRTFIDKVCFYCGENCVGNRVWTDCGCIVCHKCAKIRVSNTNNCYTCFVCGEQLPSLAYTQLSQYMPELREGFSLSSCICAICYMNIAGEIGVVFTCGDVFHADCIHDYIDNKVKADFSDEYIPCPTSQCTTLVHITALERFLSPDTFGRLYTNVMQRRSSPCPQCGHLVLDRDDNNCKKASVVCPRCNHHFCVMCSGEYSQGHSQLLCKYNLVQVQVKMAEGSALQGDMIVQCPGCKNPFVYTGGCEEAKCVVYGCGVKFCVWCAAPSCQYKTHGDGWHRPTCKLFQIVSPLVGMSPNCQVCQSYRRVCPPPPSLRTPQRFSLDEY